MLNIGKRTYADLSYESVSIGSTLLDDCQFFADVIIRYWQSQNAFPTHTHTHTHTMTQRILINSMAYQLYKNRHTHTRKHSHTQIKKRQLRIKNSKILHRTILYTCREKSNQHTYKHAHTHTQWPNTDTHIKDQFREKKHTPQKHHIAKF